MLWLPWEVHLHRGELRRVRRGDLGLPGGLGTSLGAAVRRGTGQCAQVLR